METAGSFAEMLLNAPLDGVFVVSPEGVLLFANAAGAAHVGLTPEEVIGRGLAEVFPDDIAAARMDRVAEVIETKRSLEFVDERAGRVLLSTLYPVPGDAGCVKAVAVYVRDVTQSRRADEALRVASARWEALVDAAPAIITLLDADATIRFMNRRPSGSPRDAAVGTRLTDYLLPEWRDAMCAALQEVTSTGNTVEFRTILNTSDRGVFHFENVAGPVLDGDKVTGVMLISTDISRRIRQERALEESEAKFRSIFEGGAVAMVMLGLDRRLVEVNQSLCDMLGFTREELLGKTMADITYPEDIDVDADLRPMLLEGAIPNYSIEKRYVRKDGTAVWVLLSASVIRDADGKPQFLLGQAQDLTEQRASQERRLSMERRLQHGQRLEALGALAGGVAHEFNNLLTAVLGSLELARDGVADGSLVAEELRTAEQAARRAADLARQMHAMSGRKRVAAEEADLGQALERFARVLQASLPPCIAFDVRVRPGVLVEVDLAQIQQAVAGLVSNAAEALGDGGGEVTLTVGSTYFTQEDLEGDPLCEGLAAGEYAAVQVTDNGPGMTEEVREHAFEPFFTTRLPGRGLGLPAVLGVARSHGGGMKIECGAGGGTRVTMILPLSSRSKEDPEPEEKQADGGAVGSVLLVDDEDVVRRVGERMLAALGYDCLSVAGGAEALAMLEDSSVSVSCMILDLTMPGIDGSAVLRRMEEQGIHVPVVICSGYTDGDVMMRVKGTGPAAFLQKPYRREELRAALEQVLAAGDASSL